MHCKKRRFLNTRLSHEPILVWLKKGGKYHAEMSREKKVWNLVKDL
jgi:hypothetical protein